MSPPLPEFFALDGLADIQRRYPDRFIGLAHVPPLDPAAPAELQRTVKGLGLGGLCLTTHCQGKCIDDPAYLPLYRKAAELRAPIFVHASPTPLEYDSIRVPGGPVVLGRTIDLYTAALRLAHSDILDQEPGITFVFGHLGGAFFMLKERIRGLGGFFRTPKADFESRFARIYFDSAPAWWSAAQMGVAVGALGPGQVLFGTDYPVVREWMTKGRAIMDGAGLGAEERSAVMGGNAARLLGIDA